MTENITGVKVPESEVTEWDVFGFLGRKFGDKTLEDIRYLTHGSGFCLSLPVCEGAQEGFDKIRSRNVKIYIVTSPYKRNATWHSERERWLWRMFNIDDHDVIHTHAKHLVHGDLFVDDKPDHIVSWGSRGRRTSAFLWNTHHNQDAKDLPRLSNWDELDELLESRGL